MEKENKNIEGGPEGLQLDSSRVMHRDWIRLSRELRQLKRKIGEKKAAEEKQNMGLRSIRKRIEGAEQRKEQRARLIPVPTLKTELPICQRSAEIIEAIKNHPVVIIAGDTGSGKTTQIPKMCLCAGRGIDGMIGCTQPRRIAAVSVSRRIAEEFGESIGESVGYKIRFQEEVGRNSYIKVMTDGILLAEAQAGPFLDDYDTLIIDEAHERSLNIDFILGMLKTILQKRSNLKVVITSATIDTEKFSNAFDGAPVIQVSGRSYPVKVHYVVPEGGADDAGYIEEAARVVRGILKRKPYGDILVFMPTEQDIRETCEILDGDKTDRLMVLPLFGRMTQAEQHLVFKESSRRKVVVATNVAETSITIPGIKYVVDTGLARISQYSPRSRTTGLPILPVSRSCADQRKGRCGRLENGECFRLYSEEDYLNREEFTSPEILRSNLAEVILRMMALRLKDVSAFPFVDPPKEKNITDGYNLLIELGAIELNDQAAKKKKKSVNPERFTLTPTGRIMAKIPLDPRLSRMLIQAYEEGCLDEMAVIAAALSIQDPRERPLEKKEAADLAHSVFKDASSDFMALLNIWKAYHSFFEKAKSRSQRRKFCKEHFLSFSRMREWEDVHDQIIDILRENGISAVENSLELSARKTVFSPFYAAVHRSILSGFISNIAFKKEKQVYRGAKEKSVMIFPGSFVFNTPGQWIVAAEMVETSRLFARQVANIDVEWIVDIGEKLAKYRYDHPYWDKEREEVLALETVTLFGLVIRSGKRVSFGRIDPEKASEIFIHDALVGEMVSSPLPFMVKNSETVKKIRMMEDRLRRRDLLVDEEKMVDFYRSRLPGIYGMAELKQFLLKKKSDHFLHFKEDELMNYLPDGDELAKFPSRLKIGKMDFKLSYRFDPGENGDGVMVKIPLSEALSVQSSAIEWLVPGLLEEKLMLMIKGLPKIYRKQLLPVSDTVKRIMERLPERRAPLKTVISQLISEIYGLHIPGSAWSNQDLPDHLRMRIAVTDNRGKTLRVSRDPSILHEDIDSKEGQEIIESVAKKWERKDIRNFDFEELPDHVSGSRENGTPFVFYPGLSLEGNMVSLTLFSHQKKAIMSHREGVCELVLRVLEKEIRHLRKNLVIPYPESNHSIYFGGVKKLESAMLFSIQRKYFARNIRCRKDFDNHIEWLLKLPIHLAGQDLFRGVLHILSSYQSARFQLQALMHSHQENNGMVHFIRERMDDLSRLVPENFIEIYPPERLLEMDRYMRAIVVRTDRALVNLEKDEKKKEELAVFEKMLKSLIDGLNEESSSEKRSAVEDFFWNMEEYKISLFAQEMKTKIKISPKRLNEQFMKIDQMA